MLVLSRKTGEAIMIGDDICVIVTQIKGGSVRLAVKAPAGVPIRRQELPRPQDERTDDGR